MLLNFYFMDITLKSFMFSHEALPDTINYLCCITEIAYKVVKIGEIFDVALTNAIIHVRRSASKSAVLPLS